MSAHVEIHARVVTNARTRWVRLLVPTIKNAILAMNSIAPEPNVKASYKFRSSCYF